MVLIRLLKAQIYKKSFIYLLIALIPSILVSVTTSQHQVRVVNSEYKLRAEKYANFHAMNIEKFVGETVGRLEMLSTSIIVQHDNLQDIDKILRETKGKDPRFSGFYWANTTGDIVISTNKITSPVNVSILEYLCEESYHLFNHYEYFILISPLSAIKKKGPKGKGTVGASQTRTDWKSRCQHRP